MSSVSCENEIVAVLGLHNIERGNRSVDLRDGARLVVGSDETSEICLTDDGVASTHCVISVVAGVVSVRDCYSAGGTVVDGNKIREIQLTSNAEIRLGTALISVALGGRSQQVPVVNCERRNDYDETLPAPPIEAQSPFEMIEELQSQLSQAQAEIHVLQDRLTNTATPVAAASGDPYQDEMIELLRAEALDLQAILAERDDNPPIRTHVETINQAIDDALPKAEAERLFERREQLLTELQQRDEQVSTLTELLDAAEETSRAERDERDQLNAWLRDIEERFGSREQEWQAQRQQLELVIKTVAAERHGAETAMNADTSNAKLEATQNLLIGLRQVAESQRQQLIEAEQTIAQLRGESERPQRSQTREELVQLAEERAEVARQRQDFEAARRYENRSASDDASLKLRALRQHLNEIHVQEQQEKEERKLSSRLSRLWNRLDGQA